MPFLTPPLQSPPAEQPPMEQTSPFSSAPTASDLLAISHLLLKVTAPVLLDHLYLSTFLLIQFACSCVPIAIFLIAAATVATVSVTIFTCFAAVVLLPVLIATTTLGLFVWCGAWVALVVGRWGWRVWGAYHGRESEQPLTNGEDWKQNANGNGQCQVERDVTTGKGAAYSDAETVTHADPGANTGSEVVKKENEENGVQQGTGE